jgi:hypothetical protein
MRLIPNARLKSFQAARPDIAGNAPPNITPATIAWLHAKYGAESYQVPLGPCHTCRWSTQGEEVRWLCDLTDREAAGAGCECWEREPGSDD